MSVFQQVSPKQESNCRTGKLILGNKTVQTPCFVLPTQRLAVPRITAEILKETIELTDDTAIITMTFWDLYENANVAKMQKYKEHCEKKEKKISKLLHNYINLEGYPLLMQMRDPQFPNALVASSEKTIFGDLESGRKKASVEEFMDSVKTHNTEAFTLMYDALGFQEITQEAFLESIQSSGNNTAQQQLTAAQKKKSSKKITKLLERTKKWNEVQMKELQTNSSISGNLFLPVFYHPNMFKEKYLKDITAAAGTSGKPASDLIQGIYMGDYGNLLSLSSKATNLDESVKKFLETSVALFDSQQELKAKPKMISGLDHPAQVLMAVEQGVDVFDGTYPFTLAEFGFALVFPTSPSESQQTAETKINLRDVIYEKDKRPFVEGCKCQACRLYSRAYIHHLLNAQEMLGEVCLTIHNLHHYLKFFKNIRQSIDSNSFAAYKSFILKQFSQ